jgi:tetratricopeptide (TPR) repeat protein
MYFPMTFLLLALATLLMRSPVHYRRPAIVGLIVLCVPLAVATNARNQVWGDPLAFYSDTARKAPNKFRPWFNLGTELGTQGDLDGAEAALGHAQAIDPGDSRTANQLGNIHFIRGQLDQALQQYQRAVEANTENVEAQFNLARTMDRLGRAEEAIVHYRAFLERAPPYFEEARTLASRRLLVLDIK